MISIEVDIKPEVVDMKKVLEQVAADLIEEIKKLISQGLNTNLEKFQAKSTGVIPDFYNTGTMLNSMKADVKADGFKIYIDDPGRAVVAFYLNSQKNWTFMTESKYIDDFITKTIDKYLGEQLLKL